MKAIWAYKYLASKRSSIMRWYLFVASAYSWKRFAPQFKRVLYLDKDTRNILSRLGDALDLWDELVDIEFNDLLLKTGNSYWCNAQNFAQTLQTEPFWLLDSDVVLKCPLSSWFDPKCWYAQLHIDRLSPKYGCYRDTDVDFYYDTYKRRPGLQLLNDPTEMVDGGCIYYADPRVGVLTGYALLGMQSDICSHIHPGYDGDGEDLENYSRNVGSLVEEAVYPVIFQMLGIRPVDLGEKGYVEGCIEQYFDKDRPFDEYRKTREQIDKYLGCFIEKRYKIDVLRQDGDKQ